MRISAINFKLIHKRERKNFLDGKTIRYIDGKIRKATEQEILEYEKKFVQIRPSLEENFYFSVWIENKNRS